MLSHILAAAMGWFVKKEQGYNNIPKGPFILVPNHTSYIDGPLLYFRIWKKTGRRVHFIVWRPWAEWWLTRPLMRYYGIIPTGNSVEKALEYLKKGEPVGIFPEGGRNPGKIGKLEHTGMGVLALKSGAPVVPAGLRGTHKFWPEDKKLPTWKKSIQIKIGKPSKHKVKFTKKKAMELVKKTMKKVERLAYG